MFVPCFVVIVIIIVIIIVIVVIVVVVDDVDVVWISNCYQMLSTIHLKLSK